MDRAGRAATRLPAGHVEGFADTFAAAFRAIYADVAAGGPSPARAYADFTDGHDEMLVGDAVLESSRTGRWVRRRPGGRAGAGSMKLGFLTAPFPDTPLLEVADWAVASGFEVLEIACWPRSSGPTRRYAGTSHIDVANLSAGAGLRAGRRASGPGPLDLRPRLLSQPAAP